MRWSCVLLPFVMSVAEESVKWTWWPPLPYQVQKTHRQGEAHGWLQRCYLMDNFNNTELDNAQKLVFGRREAPFPGLETINQSPTAYGGMMALR